MLAWSWTSPAGTPDPASHSLTPLRFEPQDWSTPKDAWLINRPTETKWNLWSTDKGGAKRWSKGVVLQGPTVKKDRTSAAEGAPPLHTRIAGIPPGRYDISVKAARYLGISLDGGRTWRKFHGGVLAENMAIRNGVFELWVDDRFAFDPPGPCYYDEIVLQPVVPRENGLYNPRFLYREGGKPLKWTIKGYLSYDEKAGVATLDSVPPGASSGVQPLADTRLLQSVDLAPGHYLLRALARADTLEGILWAHSLDYTGEGDRCQKITGPFRIAIGLGRDFHWVDLPFFVEDRDGASRTVSLGLRSLGYKGCIRHRIEVRELRLVRLGDTKLRWHWAEHLPMKPRHGLDTLWKYARWERPGRAIFTDTCTGAEVWLMTQGEKSYLRAQGVHSFSADGKYLYIKEPGVILRSDGSARWTGLSRGYPANEPWPAPWTRRYLPADTDPGDWVLARAPDKRNIVLRHLPTGKTRAIPLPDRAGWRLVLLPGKQNGVRLETVKHDIFAWLSDDEKKIGLSRPDGTRFREFPIRSISPDPSRDVLHWPQKLTWFQDFQDRWYVAYALNWVPWFFCYPKTAKNTVNPGQIWVLPVDEKDPRGLMRVTAGTAYAPMFMHPYLLADGTMLHWWTATHAAMNGRAGLRLRGAGCSTLALEDAVTGRLRAFVGNYPLLDHVDFSDPEFVFPESLLYPYTLLCVDVRHKAMWPLAVLQFHDYGAYTAGGGAGLLAQNPSPDVTKIACVSSMLCRTDITASGSPWDGNRTIRARRPKTALDVYNVVVRYPQPPRHVRLQGNVILWDAPPRHREIVGYNLYRTRRSGLDFVKLNQQPLPTRHFALGAKPSGFYVLTSVEYSGLESRAFSPELAVDMQGVPYRHFYEAEDAVLGLPMQPIFDQPGCSNAFAVAILDRDLLWKQRLENGEARGTGRLAIRTPKSSGPLRVLARVRVLPGFSGGDLAFSVNGAALGTLPVHDTSWHWLPVIDTPRPPPAGGEFTLGFSTDATGVALDALCVTDDADFMPTGKGVDPGKPPPAPEALRALPLSPEDAAMLLPTQPDSLPFFKLAWAPVKAPRGNHHYNVYRAANPKFDLGPETLIGSPAQAVFFDCAPADTTWYYRVAAVDAWGNRSAGSEPLSMRIKGLGVLPRVDVVVPGIGGRDTVVFDARKTRILRGKAVDWQWDFGDGTHGRGPVVRHAYRNSGDFRARLMVGTDLGERAITEVRVHLLPAKLRQMNPADVVLVEAETLLGEGGGTSRVISGRVNTSGGMVTYWEKNIGHWIEWNVRIPAAGKYAMVLKYCSGSPQAMRDLRIDGRYPNKSCRKLVFPGTGGFSSGADNWTFITLKDPKGRPLRFSLEAGTHRIRMRNLGGGMGLDYFLFVRRP